MKSTIPVDQALEDKITALMADMSLKEKVGQLIMAEIRAISPKDAKRNGVGGLLNAGGSWPTEEPGSRPVDWLAMANLFYKESARSKSKIPVIWGTDAVHCVCAPYNRDLRLRTGTFFIEKIGHCQPVNRPRTWLLCWP